MSIAVVSPKPASTLIDAEPVLARNPNNIWNRAEQHRDELHRAFSDALENEGIKGQVLKSDPFVFPPWVYVACWLPEQEKNCAERVWTKVVVDAKPYHRHEFEYHVFYSHSNKEKKVTRVVPFGQDTPRNIIRFLLHKGSKPSFRRFREKPLELWRTKNKVDVLGKDYLVLFAALVILAGVFGFSAAVANSSPEMSLGFLVVFAAGLLLTWRARKRPLVVRTEGKPHGEPRNLYRVDSWQTVIFGAGNQVNEFRRRFSDALRAKPTETFRSHLETVWYWGLDGKEEREQFVLNSGRALVFCQIYQYGSDLYVGWDGHVNFGQWAEKTIARGIDKALKKPTAISCVQPGYQVISEYDVIDLSCLMEWTHAQLVKLCKQFIQELKIDQEIDFKVLRGERQGLSEKKKEEGKSRGGLAAAFRRTA